MGKAVVFLHGRAAVRSRQGRIAGLHAIGPGAWFAREGCRERLEGWGRWDGAAARSCFRKRAWLLWGRERLATKEASTPFGQESWV